MKQTPRKKTECFIEPVASYSDFLNYVEANKEHFGFGRREFDQNCREDVFTESMLSSRYNPKWCKEVIGKEGPAGNAYWDGVRTYYPAILAFMEDNSLETVRFSHDL